MDKSRHKFYIRWIVVDKGYSAFLAFPVYAESGMVNFYWNVKEQNIAGSKITSDVILQGTTDADFFTEVEKQIAK